MGLTKESIVTKFKWRAEDKKEHRLTGCRECRLELDLVRAVVRQTEPATDATVSTREEDARAA